MQGKDKAKCPTITPKKGGSVPYLVIVKIVKAEKLASGNDPYVKFGVEESFDGDKFEASTPMYKNADDPVFKYSCLLSYGASPKFYAEVWDYDRFTSDDIMGSTHPNSQGQSLYDILGNDMDGSFQRRFPLYHKGKETEASLTVQFDFVHDPKFKMTRVDTSRQEPPEPAHSKDEQELVNKYGLSWDMAKELLEVHGGLKNVHKLMKD